MGDKMGYLIRARRLLTSMHADIKVTDSSHIYRTAPWGETDQDWFLNACIAVETSLSPEKLLDACQTIEQHLGKKKLRHWGPRTIDIDLIAYGDGRTVHSDMLTLPHPYAVQRCFVLVPLADIAPDLKLDNLTVSQHRQNMDCDDIVYYRNKNDWI